jgi:hypothetical protein
VDVVIIIFSLYSINPTTMRKKVPKNNHNGNEEAEEDSLPYSARIGKALKGLTVLMVV